MNITTTHVPITTRRLAAIVIAVAAGLAACGSTPPARSGQQADPIALTSIDAGGGGSVGGDVLAQLVQGTTSAAVAVGAPIRQTEGPQSEVDALAALRAGDADVAVLRADTLSTAGADSLRVLDLPLLIDNPEQADKVAADPVAQDLMADLSKIGLVGVTLVPGGLRHPFGYDDALLGPDDYAGKAINTRPGDDVAAIIAALGATTDHSVDAARDQLARSGELRGIEVSLQQAGAVSLPAVVTSNVTLYTKFDVVVVRADVWNGLTDGQRDDLVASARQAAKAAIAGRETETEALNRWCASKGGSSVIADDATVAAITAALQPLLDDATADPKLAPLIATVASLGDGTIDPSGKECGTPAEAPTTSQDQTWVVPPNGPQDVLQGTWRVNADRQTMIDAGVSPQDAGANSGVWTIDITGNIADVDQPNGPNCTWSFSFDGANVSLDFGANGNDACYGAAVGTYEIHDDVVTFHWDRERDYDVALDNAFLADGMHRIG